MLKVINSSDAPAAIGPYSQAILANDTLYVSGQLPVNPKTGKIEANDIEGQGRQSLKNIKAILEQAGHSINDVVKCVVYLSDLNNFAGLNKVYAEFFGNHKPARVCLQISKIPMGSLVEIDAISVK